MWYSSSLLTALLASLLFCTCTAYSSYAEFESSNAGQYPSSSSHQGSSWSGLDEDRNTYSYGGTDSQRDLKSNFLDISSWPDRESITRQLFGDTASESSEPRMGVEDNEEDISKSKRESHSLSIVNPLDVLRQRLMLEMARRRMKENQDQIRENAVILKNLGKRSAASRSFQESPADAATRTNQDYLRRIHVSNPDDFDI